MRRVVKLYSKELFGVFLADTDLVGGAVQDLNGNFSSSLLVSELQSALADFIVFSRFRSLTLIMEVNSLVLALDGAIRVVLTVHDHGAVAFGHWVADVACLFKGQAAWLIVIEDGDSAFSVTSNKSVSISRVIELDEEIFIRLPAFIIDNLNLDNFRLLSGAKGNDLVYGFEIFGSGGGIIACTYTNSSSDSILI